MRRPLALDLSSLFVFCLHVRLSAFSSPLFFYLSCSVPQVSALSSHEAIFAWELGNELTDVKNSTRMLTFVSAMSEFIKSLDSNHMVLSSGVDRFFSFIPERSDLQLCGACEQVTTGFISIDHTGLSVEQGIELYSLPHIDFLTLHTYCGQPWPVNRRVYCAVNSKPMIVEEFGWAVDGACASNPDRVANTQRSFDQWFTGARVRGFMNWGFQAQNHDIGDGDSDFGIDSYSHPDYSALTQHYTNQALQSMQQPNSQPHNTSTYCA